MRVARVEHGVAVEICEINRPIVDFPRVLYIEASEAVTIGWLYDGTVFTPHAGYLNEQKLLKLPRLTKSCQTAIQQPVGYMGTTFQADDDSQTVLTMSLAPGVVPADFAWLDATNNSVPMTLVQLQGLAGVMLDQGWTAFKRLQNRKNAVRVATSIEELNAVVW